MSLKVRSQQKTNPFHTGIVGTVASSNGRKTSVIEKDADSGMGRRFSSFFLYDMYAREWEPSRLPVINATV